MSQPSNQAPEEVNNAAKSDEAQKTPSNGGASEPSGVKGDNPSTAGPGPTAVQSPTPENATGHINPSSPEDSNVTPGSATLK